MGKSLTNVLIFTSIAAVFASSLVGIFLVLNPNSTQEAFDTLVKVLLVLGIVAVGSIVTLLIIKTTTKS